MLEPPEYGWFVPMRASEDPALDGVRAELLDVMHNFSEDYDFSSWSSYLPWMVWDCITTTEGEDGGRQWLWVREGPHDDERADIMALAERAGGWWCWPKGNDDGYQPCPCEQCSTSERDWNHMGIVFVPLDVWRRAVAMGDNDAAERMIVAELRGAR